jgi:phosphotransferase system  glucose/maltose/N-acetylglucosamine-specific IIC component
LYGNAELVEEEHVIFDSQEITFISVVTKSGNVFYVLIDHRIADKTKNVYFLNKVDEYDLLSLIYKDQTDEDGNPVAVPAPSSGQKEEVVTTVSTEKTSEKSKTTNTVKKEPVIPTLSIVILAIVALGGGAFAIWWVTSKKKNKPNSSVDGYDDDDDEFYTDEKE